MRLRTKVRRGMTIVEATLVMSVLALFLFGILEYARFLMVLHVTHNAARDASRYAVVNQDKPANFDDTNFTDGAGRVYLSIKAHTTYRMGSVQRQLTNFEVTVYPVASSGLSATPPTIVAKATIGAPAGTIPDPWNPSDPYLAPWNNAIFPEGIAVSIRGTYKPLLPGFLLMPSEIPVNVTFVSGSGG